MGLDVGRFGVLEEATVRRVVMRHCSDVAYPDVEVGELEIGGGGQHGVTKMCSLQRRDDV